MNEYAMQHITESKYCFAIDSNTVRLRLRVDKNDEPEKVEVVYGGKYTFALERKAVLMRRAYTDRLFAWYTAQIKLDDLRFVYVFKITQNGKVKYFSEDGLTDIFDFELSYYNCFQYAYLNDCDILKPVEWMRTARFYQIFVERFNIGDKSADKSYVNLKWGGIPNPKSFAGGDLKGIIQKLEYIKDVGADCLYLTPVFKAISNHKYDISDYFNVDLMFGDKATLKELIDKAHALGMKVVLDAVFNHCSEYLPQFQNVLKNGRNSPYCDWFIIKSFAPLDYECFAACKYMPKFNTGNAEVKKFLIDIGKYWIEKFDIDGWRLDVSDEVSHEFWREFRKEIKHIKPDCLLLGENWHDANVYLHGDEFDGIMNYAFTKACLDFYAFDRFTPEQFAEKLNELLMRNTDTVNLMMLNLLDSHDTDRFITRVGGDKDKLMSALAVMYFFVGAPCLYYGTEIALEGGYDPDNRRCMDWERANEKTQLKDVIAKLSYLKQNCLKDDIISIKESGGLVIIERGGAGGLTLAVNGCGRPIRYEAKEPLLSNKYDGHTIEDGGFAVHKT